jgi:hypothetical protein
VTQIPDTASLAVTDLSQFDVVWMPDGIDPANTACSGRLTIPSPEGASALFEYLAAGGALYMSGESDSNGQTAFLSWRDAFITDTLEGGLVDGTCQCDMGSVMYPDPAHPINTAPNVIATIGAGTVFTGGFDAYGSGEPIVYASSLLAGRPVGVLWDVGTLAAAPEARLVVYNNTNNTDHFAPTRPVVWPTGSSRSGCLIFSMSRRFSAHLRRTVCWLT